MKTLDIFSKLNAATEEDILLHFPKRYDDMTPTDLTFPLLDNQKAVVFGSIKKMSSIQGGRIIRLEVYSLESSITVPCMIFGQPFYARVLKKDRNYYFIGTYKQRQKSIMVSSCISEDSPLVAHKYKPYYALPHDVSQSSFYSLVLEILQYRNSYIHNVLPPDLIQKYRLEDRLLAFKDVHIPISEEVFTRGLRVFKYEEALKYCLYSLYQKEQSSSIKKKIVNLVPKDKINLFIKSLSFKLTSDQITCIREIIIDMDSEIVMNRLLQGDVGTGKTIVAFTIMYANYLRGGQSVLLAPTATLAEQHYLRAKEVFAPYHISIIKLDNSLTKKEQTEAYKSIKSGESAFIIGTHSVFSDSVVYNNLTLVVTDEQHKFGVEQREKLIQKGNGVDLLSMSATPIPRTLSMMINSDINVSFLSQYPFNKREVVTKRVTSLDPIINQAIKRALAIHKQVFIVAPKIEKNDKSSKISSVSIYEDVCKAYGEENVSLMTGKVKKDEQEAIYRDFSSGKKLILVSTSLIEVGVDVKNAALMIIYEANYFGLASLHQLRGRIGRDGNGAMALLVYDGDDKDAIDKLDFISTHTSGEDIAMYDLEHRGSGDLLSSRQSGESYLQVANFVTDFKIFQVAKEDAMNILTNQSINSNKVFLEYVLSNLSKEK